MGWQQYSRPLWLSRPNHYILYLKAMTAQIRLVGSVFHSGCEAVFHRSAGGLPFPNLLALLGARTRRPGLGELLERGGHAPFGC
jgi:hypothetical protein